MDQKITFEDGKLVILTDNGKISGDETTTKLAGTFTVNAEDAEFIRKLIDKKRYTMILTTEYSQDDGSKRSHIFRSVETSDDAIAEEFGNMKNQLNKANRTVRTLRDLIHQINTNFEWKLSRTYRWLVWGLVACAVICPISGIAESIIFLHWYDGIPECLYAVAIGFFTRALHLDSKSAAGLKKVFEASNF